MSMYLNILPGNFLVLNDALVIIDLDTGVLQVLLLTGVPTVDTIGDCPPKHIKYILFSL